MLDRRDNLLQLLTPAAPRIVTAPAARSAAAAKPGAALSAAGRAAVGATLFKPRPAILVRAPISLVGSGSLRNARTAATPTPAAPPAPAFNLETWGATNATAYLDPHDATKRTLSGSDVLSLTSKGTAGALLSKVIAGTAELVTLASGQQAVRLTLGRMKARNAGDTADVPIGSLIAAGAGCVLVVARFPGGTNRGLFADSTAGQNVFTTGAPNMQYWCGSYFNASGPGLANDTLAILGFHHDGTNIWVSVNGVAGTPTPTSAPLSNVSVAAFFAGSDSGTTTTVDLAKYYTFNVATPADFAAAIAALKALYSIA